MNCFSLLLNIVALTTVAHGNGWCNQPAFQKYSISSPLLFSCDDSEIKTEISSLRQEIQESYTTQLKIEQLQGDIRELQQVCNVSALVTEISQLREMISVLKDSVDSFLSSDSTDSASKPATNCSEIFQQDSTVTTGTYLLSTGDGAVNVTCNFDVQLPPPSPVRGWQEIANINMSDPTNSCPSPLRETTSPSRRCEKSSDSAGCESVFFPTNRVPFSKLCGRAVGYAVMSVDLICTSCTIDDPYVEGISITYSNDTGRQHIWTFIAADLQISTHCPCGSTPHRSSPPFVGNDYYCEAEKVRFSGTTPLWDGEGCDSPSEAACCANPNLPWFCREFDQPIVTDDVEVRVCRDEERSNEDIEFDLLKLYIQ